MCRAPLQAEKMQFKKLKCDENIHQKITDYTPLTAIFGKTLIRI